MTWLALPWFVLVATGSAKQMTLVIAAEAAGYALFGIPSGTLLERLGPQRTMRLCDAVRAPLMLLVPVLHWSGDLSLPLLLGPHLPASAWRARRTAPRSAWSSRRSSTRTKTRSSGRTPCSRGPHGSRCSAARHSRASSSRRSGRLIVLVVDAASYVVSFALVTLFVPVARVVRSEDEPEGGRGCSRASGTSCAIRSCEAGRPRSWSATARSRSSLSPSRCSSSRTTEPIRASRARSSPRGASAA